MSNIPVCARRIANKKLAKKRAYTGFKDKQIADGWKISGAWALGADDASSERYTLRW